ncbi:uncharacterized protein LAESUDRAFT_760861 [Laetiporus sulphureus 93-53]|uniref:BTB domain-containing protein n=1 Tax=Laetiporus sulphureus 93-53 TaxID=1314785 RepID=A0A165DGV8_9APHY|nr:uncharacterized protein LAESUDRAFT_760861 [Laetiporus sulphureus 93-53]KZT04851.1 hypothetical protein LAESUDRAFT_760861 [Laetiporus sulphureus 93-53]
MTRKAEAPFDKPSADIILRSADGVDFYVHTVILGLASTVFEDMFSLSHPGTACRDQKLPIVDITETSETLNCLLRLIYPNAKDPIFKDIVAVGSVLKAATKYQMDTIATKLKSSLSAFADPLGLYAIACCGELQMEQEAMQAAEEWAESSQYALADYTEGMDDIGAGCYFRALQFISAHRSGRALSTSFTFCHPSNATAAIRELATSEDPHELLTVPAPFDCFSTLSSDIVLQSSDGLDFYANKAIIVLASPKLAEELDKANQRNTSSDGFRVVSLTLDGQTLLRLLQLCYPMTCPKIDDWETLTDTLKLAAEYDMEWSIDDLKRRWLGHVESHPLQSYFLAMRHGWAEEAELAAQHAALSPVDTYVPEMEAVSASVYRHYLEYRQKWRKLISRSARKAFGYIPVPGTGDGLQESAFWNDQESEHSPGLERRLHAVWAMCRKDEWNFDVGDITMLVDDADNLIVKLSQKQPQKAAKSLNRKCKDYCLTYIHAMHRVDAGHGGQVNDVDGDEVDGIDEVIYPSDFNDSNYILDDNLHELLYDVYGDKSSEVSLNYVQIKSSPADVYSFSSCEDSEKSKEIRRKGKMVGVLTEVRVRLALAMLSRDSTQTIRKAIMKSFRKTNTPEEVLGNITFEDAILRLL